MDQEIQIRPLSTIGDDIVPLLTESIGEGYRFVQRLREDWQSGLNRFQGKGECLLAVYVGERLVAVGGLNKDPYSGAEDIGRLRHVYVASSTRRLGVGTRLVKELTSQAARAFSILRLRTTTAEAAIFYERLGFMATNVEAATHVLDLVPVQECQLRPQRRPDRPRFS